MFRLERGVVVRIKSKLNLKLEEHRLEGENRVLCWLGLKGIPLESDISSWAVHDGCRDVVSSDSDSTR